MAARYLVRFDDICPTMNWAIWSRVETLLDEFAVKPIVAVVPDNRDPKLAVAPAREDFWSLARGWQSRGWTIGLHGYQHLYSTNSGGLVDIHAGSEFADVPADQQRAKLAAGLKILADQGLTPKVWVAPGHAFDRITVRLLPEHGIDVLSDGFYWRPVRRDGLRWIPQQLWRFRPMPLGVWTVCLHINSWNDAAVDEFERGLQRFKASIVTLEEVLEGEAPQVGILDRAFEAAYGKAVRARLRGNRNH